MELIVKVIEGKDLPKLDVISESDPYCMLQLFSDNENNNKKIYKTRYINNNPNPQWNEEFTIPVYDKTKDILVIVVKDKDLISADDPIGKYQICMKDLMEDKEEDIRCDLKSMCKFEKAGKIHLSLKLQKSKEKIVPNAK